MKLYITRHSRIAHSIIATALSLAIMIISLSALANLQDKIAERLKPVGSICKVGDECAVSAAQAASTGPREASSIYNTGCLACHQAGVGGAPKTGEASQWAERLTKGIDILYANAYNGINAMPAKGLCADCSEEEIRSVVDYILEQSK